MMKAKLLVGFGQVLSYYPVVFDTIPWPPALANLMKSLEFMSVDIFSVFGGTTCRLQTGFLTQFRFHMALVPGIMLILFLAFGIVYATSKSSKVFSPESVKTQLHMLTSLVLYTLYVGVATRIFRLFKCRQIMSVWYLTSDYSVVCFEGEWISNSILAFVCMVAFVVGIPLGQFFALWSNRKYLDKSRLKSDEDYHTHLKVKQKYGSIFEAYTADCYYYDLIDLVRAGPGDGRIHLQNIWPPWRSDCGRPMARFRHGLRRQAGVGTCQAGARGGWLATQRSSDCVAGVCDRLY